MFIERCTLFAAAWVICAGQTATVPEDDITTGLGGGEWSLEENRVFRWLPVTIEGVNLIQFTMRGRSTGYIAITMSSNFTVGEAADTYVCSRSISRPDEIRVSSGYQVGLMNPVIEEQIPQNMVVEVALEREFMTCVFLRPIRVSKLVSGMPMMFDLSENDLYLLFTEGLVSSSGEIAGYIFRQRTYHNFRMIEVPRSKPRVTETAMPSNRVPPRQFHPENNITDLANGGGIWAMPTSCSGNCKVVRWEPEPVNGTHMVKITLKGIDRGWLGFSFVGMVASKVGSNCYLCYRTSKLSSRVHVAAASCKISGPPVFDVILPDALILEAVSSNNEMRCSFLRPLIETKIKGENIYTYNLTAGPFTYMFAEGMLTPVGGIGLPVYIGISSRFHSFVNLSRYQLDSSTEA